RSDQDRSGKGGRVATAYRRHYGRAFNPPGRVSANARDVPGGRDRRAGAPRRDGAPAFRPPTMSEFRAFRILIILAGLMGADGVILAAIAAHQADASQLAPASSMLLFHAIAVLAVVALSERGIVNPGGGIAAAFGFVAAAALFAADLSLRHFSGHS